MNALNPEQQIAVQHMGSPLLVLAGAGSGKTRVITHKIAWLIHEANYRANQIAAITFTNKAAREMRERVSELLDKKIARGLMVSTFHTLGLKIIRSEYKTLGYQSNFSIFDSQDSKALLKELSLKEEDWDEMDGLQGQISRWKNDFIRPTQTLESALSTKDQVYARLYQRYQRQLKAYNALDFDDLIVLPVKLFQEHPDILQKWQNKLRYLLVDEYQDTNICQYQLIKLLAGVRAELTVVGDDDQSIYAWRGAKPENINQLQQDYPLLKVVKLEQNYRSSQRILASANHLIANNPHLFDKKLWSALTSGDPVRIIPCATAEKEAERIISEIMIYCFKKQLNYKDFAILYRSNYQARLFERALRENQIPYKITGGLSFFERAEVKDIMAYLRLLANNDDDTAFLRIINTPRRKIGASTLETLGNYANQRNISLFAASNEIGLAQRLNKNAYARLAGFSRWIKVLQSNAEELDPHCLAKRLITDITYEAWLLENSSSAKIAERRMKNVLDVLDWMKRLYDDSDGKESLSEIMSHMALMDLLERNTEEEEQNQVNLMTLHSAKGLEFPCVFLVGFEEDLLPHSNSLEQESLEEERRLAYVGITRAKQHLIITFAKVRRRYGETETCDPSRFLDELPEQHIEWQNRKVISQEERKATAKAYLDDLDAFLAD